MKTLFIDTNILLSFYHLSSDDLEELRKLIALIDTEQIELIVTEQVKDEFFRNRGAKIVDAMKELQKPRYSPAFPAFAKDYPEYAELRKLLSDAGKKHSKLVDEMAKDAASSKLKADDLVSDLFKKAKLIKITETLYIKALARVRRGNPPGKESSIGDALNWGGLLTEIDEWTDLYFVSEDKDYRSQLSPATFNEFLRSEWEERKTSEIFFYTRISDFFKANFPNIKIASDIEKDRAIQELADSGSFIATHLAIGRLSKHSEFTALQIEELVRIAQSNNQVGWIAGDLDVHEFYKSLLKNKNQLQSDVAEQLQELVKKGLPEQNDDDIPF
jgi:predicted nucleic acid-binding protein